MAERAASGAAPLTLYGAAGSGSAAIEAALERCGARYRRVEAATWLADSALDELRRVNPLQQIPTLLTADGRVLTESAAILMHLAWAYPAAGLLPSDAPVRDQAVRGLVYIAANCYSAIGIIDYPERWCDAPDQATKDAILSAARARLHRHWDVFDSMFPAPAQFFGGAAPGALDLLAAVVSKWAGTRAHLRAARPALSAWLERVDADAVVAPVFARHWPAKATGQSG